MTGDLSAGGVRGLAGEDFYRKLFEASPDGIVTVDESSTIVQANDSIERILGHDPDELVGESLLALIPERLRQEHLHSLQTYLRTGERNLDWDYVELPALHSDGHEVPVSVAFREHRHEDDRFFTGFIRDITERKRQEERLERLNRVNTVIRGTNQALVAAATREEVERAVCDHLTVGDTYEFGWISPHPETSRRSIRASSGADVDLLEERDGTADDVVEAAAETGEVQVRSIDPGPGSPPWQVHAVDRGCATVVAVPLLEDRFVHGVLTLVTNRDAVDDEEERVLAELGETIGSAIGAAQHRALLFADAVTELEFRTDDPDSFFVSVSEAADCRMELEEFVPRGGGELLYYMRISRTDPETIRELVAEAPEIRGVRVVSESDEGLLCEFVVAGSSLVWELTQHGARVHTAVADGGEGELVVEVAPQIDVRRLVENVQEAYPNTELVTKREREREVRRPTRFRELFEERLTERQRAVLEAAYAAGYFEWPRETSGDELAASLDISPPTLHEHLRAAERQLTALLFEEFG